KFTMVLLGHPLFAGGRYQGGEEELPAGEWVEPERPTVDAGGLRGADTEPFAAVHRLLREHQVAVVMAGDTHYFEHYVERYPVGHRRVAGGGLRLWLRPFLPEFCRGPGRGLGEAGAPDPARGQRAPPLARAANLRRGRAGRGDRERPGGVRHPHAGAAPVTAR